MTTTVLDPAAWSTIAAQYVHVAGGRTFSTQPLDVSEALGNLFGDVIPGEETNVTGDVAFHAFSQAAELGFRVAIATLTLPAGDALPQIRELIAEAQRDVRASIAEAVAA